MMIVTSHTDGVDALVFVGMPLEWENRLYNVAAVINCGEIIGFVPKTCIPAYGEFYETRHFAPGNKEAVIFSFQGEQVPFGTHILLEAEGMEGLVAGCEICEDIWAPDAPGISHALAGANLVVNLSASNELTGKDCYRKSLVEGQSARLLCGYVYASAGEGESTQDVVYSAHNMIAENGILLAEAQRFQQPARLWGN